MERIAVIEVITQDTHTADEIVDDDNDIVLYTGSELVTDSRMDMEIIDINQPLDEENISEEQSQSWGFTSRSTARVILGQVLRIATCGTRTHRGDSLWLDAKLANH